MSWTVEWSEASEAGGSEAESTVHIHLALSGEEEALSIAGGLLERGCIVWSIKRDHGILEMNKYRVFHHFYPFTS